MDIEQANRLLLNAVETYFENKKFEIHREELISLKNEKYRVDLLARKGRKKVIVETKLKINDIRPVIYQLVKYSPFADEIYLALPLTDEHIKIVYENLTTILKLNFKVLFVDWWQYDVVDFLKDYKKILDYKSQLKVENKLRLFKEIKNPNPERERVKEIIGRNLYKKFKKNNVPDKELIDAISITQLKTKQEAEAEFEKKELINTIFSDLLVGGLLAGGIFLLIDAFVTDVSLKGSFAIIFILLSIFGWVFRTRNSWKYWFRMHNSSNSKIIKSWSLKQYLLFFTIIPFILLIIYLLPQSVKDSYFIMDIKNLSLTSIFLSNYTHSDLFMHLVPNILIYMLVIFLIFKLETRKKTFYKSALLIFMVLPVLSSIAVIYFLPSMPPVQGFSAIVAGLIGYFTYCVYNYIKNIYKIRLKPSFVWLVLMINFTLLTAIQGNIYFSAITLITSVFLLYDNRKNMKGLLKEIISKYFEALKIMKTNFLESFYKIAVFMFSAFFMFQLPLLVPINIIMGGAVINTFAHYVGYCLGLVIPLAICKIYPKLE